MTKDDLSPWHYELLLWLHSYRFATTKQLATLRWKHHKNLASATRQTQRHLQSLFNQKLVYQLDRRVGGWRQGSAQSVWTLTAKGARTIHVDDQIVKRSRPKVLSTTFLEHALAVTELRVRLEQAVQEHEIKLCFMQTEPAAHRKYLDSNGSTATLKPDGACGISSKEHEDFYFFEVDRATENPARVMKKCEQYEAYRATGLEQKELGVFPAVIWVVPHTKRRKQLRRYIAADMKLTNELFSVITLDELPKLIQGGSEAFSVSDADLLKGAT